jgi:CheY-like chemotaxis protein
MNLEVIEGLLEDTKMKVATADSGRACLEILKKDSFDVIFLDQMMPGMSGVQTLEEIKKQGLAKDIPIIALTADAIVGARDNYIKEGFSDYLSKPVMYEALEAILLKYLDPDLISEEDKSADKTSAGKKNDGKKPVVLVVNDSREKLETLKETLGDRVKGVYVRDEESARKYLEKHKADYILRDGGQ